MKILSAHNIPSTAKRGKLDVEIGKGVTDANNNILLLRVGRMFDAINNENFASGAQGLVSTISHNEIIVKKRNCKLVFQDYSQGKTKLTIR